LTSHRRTALERRTAALGAPIVVLAMFFIFAWAALPAAAGPRKPVSHVKEYANEVAFWNARRTMWVDDANTQAGGLQDAITQMEDAQASGSQDAVNAYEVTDAAAYLAWTKAVYKYRDRWSSWIREFRSTCLPWFTTAKGKAKFKSACESLSNAADSLLKTAWGLIIDGYGALGHGDTSTAQSKEVLALAAIGFADDHLESAIARLKQLKPE
jgi:hypothetical protein